MRTLDLFSGIFTICRPPSSLSVPSSSLFLLTSLPLLLLLRFLLFLCHQGSDSDSDSDFQRLSADKAIRAPVCSSMSLLSSLLLPSSLQPLSDTTQLLSSFPSSFFPLLFLSSFLLLRWFSLATRLVVREPLSNPSDHQVG